MSEERCDECGSEPAAGAATERGAAAEPGEPASKAGVWAAMSGLPAKSWAAVSGAATKSWASLPGLGAKLKATGQKLLGASVSWWKNRSKRVKVVLAGAGAAAVVAIGVTVFLVLFFRPVYVVEAFAVDDAVVSGDDVAVSLEVVNEGRTTGDCKLRLLVDGERVQTKVFTLDPGARQKVSMALTELPAGHYDIALAGWSQLAQEVWVMTPPEFQMGAVQVQPNPMNLSASTQAAVTVNLSNVGEAAGSHKFEVTLDGAVVETREVEVQGGDSVDESFTVEVTKPGSCAIGVNGKSVDVVVYQLGRPSSGERIAQRRAGNYSRVRIKNNDDMDCVVVLQEQGEDPAYLAVYVRAHSECLVVGILGGTYTASYTFGNDWCLYRKEFTRDQRSGKFDSLLKFEQELAGIPFGRFAEPKIEYTAVTLELGGPSGESVSTGRGTHLLPIPEFPW